MLGMKKIFIIIFLGAFFLTPIAANAVEYKSCCVCINIDTSGMGQDYYTLPAGSTKENPITAESTCDTHDAFAVDCMVMSHEECGEVAPPVMTTLSEEMGLQNVVLGVAIPNLHFSAPPTEVDEYGNIYIPWAGEYVKAIYNFAVVVISVLAVVVLILSGAQIITSAGGPAKGAAYKRITQAIIGLFIAWGSYLVLYTINPGLTQFKSLAISFIQSDPYTIELGTTQENTVSEEGGQPMAGSYAEKFTECPLQLSSEPTFVAPEKEPRTLDFYKQIGEIVTTAIPPTERVIQIANAAVKCGVHFGSCGRTAGTILALAGFGDPACLNGGAAYRRQAHEGQRPEQQGCAAHAFPPSWSR